MSELRIYRRHLAKAKLCRAETQDWMVRNGFDWVAFMRDGVPVSALADFDNVFVRRVIAVAEAEQEDDRE